MNFIIDMWNKNKILFFILLPALIVIAALSVLSQSDKIRDITKDAEDKDSDLLKKQTELNTKADEIVKDANKKDDKTRWPKVDKNWHKNLLIITALLMIPTNAGAACDWKTIKETDEGFVYSEECHIEVGMLAQEVEIRKEQVEDLNKAINLKDLALDTANQRIELWKKSTLELETEYTKREKAAAYTKWAYIGSGILLTVLAGWAVGQAGKR